MSLQETNFFAMENHHFFSKSSTHGPCSIASWWFQPTPLKNHGVKVSWDDDIPNVNGKIKFIFQTTNQIAMLPGIITDQFSAEDSGSRTPATNKDPSRAAKRASKARG